MDPFCFLGKDEEHFFETCRDRDEHFAPQPCPYMRFQHGDDASNVKITEAELAEDTVFDFVKSPRETGYHSELRLLISPPRRAPAKISAKNTFSDRMSPYPFSAVTFSSLLHHCEFHRAFLEDEARVRVVKTHTKGKTSIYIGAEDNNPEYYNVSVFISVNHQDGVVTAFIHNCTIDEREHLIGRLHELPVIPLSRHPMFIPIIIMEWLCQLAKEDVKDTTDHAITPLWDAGIFGSELMTLEVEDPEKKAVESLRTFHSAIASATRLGDLLSTMNILISWCKDFEGNNEQTPEQQKHFTDAAVIIHDRLVCLQDSLRSCERNMITAQSYLQIYRQWLDVHIANTGNRTNVLISEQSRDIARDSKLDSSAMKAIAVLTMVFLPGTFFASLFAMPLFDWNASTSLQVVKSRSWIYWVVTVPSTILVLIFWRIWFKFDSWRMGEKRGERLWDDVAIWLRSGRKKETDVEDGKDVHKSSSLVVEMVEMVGGNGNENTQHAT